MRRFSSTDMAAKTRRASGTEARPRPIRADVDSAVASAPPIDTVPAVGRSRPSAVFMVVDLPEALPPSRQTISPSSTWRETPASACTGP